MDVTPLVYATVSLRSHVQLVIQRERKSRLCSVAVMDEALRREGWFLGCSTEDTAKSILRTSGAPSTFVVYKNQNNDYLLSARLPIEGVAEDLIETVAILSTLDGRVYLAGQDEPSDDVVTAINIFTNSWNPPLQPALGKKDHIALQLSISEPPEYDEANRHLLPDVAQLPNISGISPDLSIEAQPGMISPTSSFRHEFYHSYGSSGSSYGMHSNPPPPHMSQPHWWRYRDLNCCHPKNVCHCLCYRDTVWRSTSSTERYRRSWYDIRNTGPLRCLLLGAMWACCGWPVVLCILCCYCCIVLICGHDDD